MSDAALDRELEAALAVDPSPEFVARVRMRVAREPQPPARWIAWPWVAAVAAGAMIVAVLAAQLFWRADDRSVQRANGSAGTRPVDRKGDDVPEDPVRSSASADQSPRPAASATAAIRRARPARPLVPDVRGTDVVQLPLGEVLISQDEVHAYEAVLISVQGRPARSQRDATVVAANASGDDGSMEVPEIDVAPLVIEPLPPVARLETGELP